MSWVQQWKTYLQWLHLHSIIISTRYGSHIFTCPPGYCKTQHFLSCQIRDEPQPSCCASKSVREPHSIYCCNHEELLGVWVQGILILGVQNLVRYPFCVLLDLLQNWRQVLCEGWILRTRNMTTVEKSFQQGNTISRMLPHQLGSQSPIHHAHIIA